MKRIKALHCLCINSLYETVGCRTLARLNALVIILLIPLLIVIFLFPGESLWRWNGMGFYLTSALVLMAVIAFFYSL